MPADATPNTKTNMTTTENGIKSAPPTTYNVLSSSERAPPSPSLTRFIRIIHYPAPDLSYTIQIRNPPVRKPKLIVPLTEHTLDDEPTLFDFSTSTFSFNNFGPCCHFIDRQTNNDIASITKVQWEAHNSWDVAGGSTLTVAKMLVDKLPGLKEVVIRLVMRRSESEHWIVKKNLAEWKEGLEKMKEGLCVVVRKQGKRQFDKSVEGGSVRKVDTSGGAARRRKVRGLLKTGV